MQLLAGLDWRGDHFLLGGYRFVLQHQVAGDSDTGADGFHFFKNRSQLEQYERFLTTREAPPRRLLELGIWDGGSAAFWTETLDLEAYAAIDIRTRDDSDYYRQWAKERGQDRVHTHWGVDQTDASALLRIVEERHLQPLDLVIDDCSHMPGPTLRSFEILFPLLPAGAHYVIEDWAWALQPEYQSSTHPWGYFPALHTVVDSLVRLHGSRPDLIDEMSIYPDMVTLRRGPGEIPAGWSVESSINRRRRPWLRIARRRVKVQALRIAAARRRGG